MTIIANAHFHRIDHNLLGHAGVCNERRCLCRYIGIILQIDLHLAGSGMFGDIVERFLADPVERHLDFCRENMFPGDVQV